MPPMRFVPAPGIRTRQEGKESKMSRSVSKRSIPPADTLSWGGTNTVGKNEYSVRIPVRNILKKAFWSVLDCKNKKPQIGTPTWGYVGFRYLA